MSGSMWRAATLGFAGVLATWPASALDPDRPLAEFDVTSWTQDDGLPQNFVADVIESPDGHIWAATWLGAARFNGIRFTIFDRKSLPWVRDGSAYRFSVGGDGTLLVASQKYGVSRYQHRRWSQHPWATAEKLPSLYAFAEDGAGRLWVGSDEGLIRWDGRTEQRFGLREGMPDTGVFRIVPGPDGSVWVACATGAVHIVDDRITVYGQAQGLPAGGVNTILVQRDGTVRVGTRLGAYVLEQDRFRRDPEALPQDLVSEILLDRAGALWIGTAQNGLYRVTPRGFEQLSRRNGLPNDQVSALAEDRQGNLWIGTFGGLSMLSPARYHEYSRIDGLAEDSVRAVAAHADGSIWAATIGGVSRIVEGRIETLAERDARGKHAALSLLMRRNGEVWIGTHNQGVTIFDAASARTLDRASGLVSDEVRAMLETRDGSLWIGSPGAITRLRDGQAPRHWLTIGESKQTPFVRALLEDSGGRVWLGLQPGLAWVEGDEVRVLEDFVRSGHGVFGLRECPHGAIWVAGQGGLRRWKDGELRTLDARHGLADTTLFAIVPDARGRDWFTSAVGLFGIDHDQLEAAMDGSPVALEVRREGQPGSRKALASNGGSTPSAMVGSDGRLWLATQRGVAVFDPERVETPPAAPPTVIESVEVDGEVREAGAVLQLPAGTRRVEFQFAGLSYSAQDALEYRYRLDGYDEEWTHARSTSASYTNLAPGDYRFRVEALLEEAADEPIGASQSLQMLPHLYQTPVFRLLLGAAGLALLGVAYRLRVGGLRRRATELQNLVNERTGELRQRSQSLEAADREKAILIDRLREQSLVLERRSQQDGLTGLANRRHLDSQLEAARSQCARRNAPISVGLIDIDHFKAINDRHGHATGDHVLRRIAATILESVGPDGIAGRYGGEEFAIVFSGLDVEASFARCEALRRTIEDLDLDNLAPGLRVTVSIGVGDVVASQVESAYELADRNLYVAKRGGRNQVVGS
jgi:diguanylate cyclase (GGDEF)-like protein